MGDGAGVDVNVEGDNERKGAADMALAGEGSETALGIEISSEAAFFTGNPRLLATRGVEVQPMRVR